MENIKLNDKEQLVRKYLIDLAHNNNKTTYQEVSDDCDLNFNMMLNKHRREIGELLDKVSLFEHKLDRPILSALVILAKEKIQGEGFFKLCEDLEPDIKLSNEPSPEEIKEFSKKMINKCFEYWGKEENYSKDYEI